MHYYNFKDIPQKIAKEHMIMTIFKYNPEEITHNAQGTTDVQMIAFGEGVMVRAETCNYVGPAAPMHSHYHEQVSYIERGSMRVIREDGTSEILHAGDAAYFAPNEPHATESLEVGTKCVDSFTPIRVDHLLNHLKALDEQKKAK